MKIIKILDWKFFLRFFFLSLSVYFLILLGLHVFQTGKFATNIEVGIERITKANYPQPQVKRDLQKMQRELHDWQDLAFYQIFWVTLFLSLFLATFVNGPYSPVSWLKKFARNNIVVFEYYFFGQASLLVVAKVNLPLVYKITIFSLALLMFLLGLWSLDLPENTPRLIIIGLLIFLSVLQISLVISSITTP